MPYKLNLKAKIIESGFKLSDINNELNRRHGTNLGYQNFSNKLSNETFKYDDVVEVLDIIGYDVSWNKRDN